MNVNWNQRYLIGDTPWEKGAPAPPLQEIHEKRGPGIWGGGTVLVPGCGMGHDARWLASRGLVVRGLDIAEEAVIGARQLTEGPNPTFEQQDFFRPEAGAVSAVWEHTCFCAIDPADRKRYAAAAAEWLPAGGCLVGVFFLTPGHEGDGPPHGTTVAELDEVFGPYFDVIDEWEPVTGYPGRVGSEWARVMQRR